MASIYLEPKSGVYHLRFWWGKRSISRTLKTKNEKQADAVRARVEETISLIEGGRLTVPEGADVVEFIISDGKRTESPKAAPRPLTFGELVDKYLEAIPADAKAASTIQGEKFHIEHMRKIIGDKTRIPQVGVDKIQTYVNKRAKQKWRDKPISAATIQKELRTLRIIWNWAAKAKHVTGPAPIHGVNMPLPAQKAPFRTWGEIEAIVKGIEDKSKHAELWECLFLSIDQVIELMAFVKQNAAHPFIVPMFAFAAWAGARRSEIARSLREDWNLSTGVVTIREKKRVRGKSLSYRDVPIHPELRKVIEEWFAVHPGGRHAIVEPAQMQRRKAAVEPVPLTPDSATHHFNQTLDGSKWEVLRGFHTLRHSFASNLASKGVAQHLINAWMGHQSEEMVNRYRHLFPSDHARAIEALTASLKDN